MLLGMHVECTVKMQCKLGGSYAQQCRAMPFTFCHLHEHVLQCAPPLCVKAVQLLVLHPDLLHGIVVCLEGVHLLQGSFPVAPQDCPSLLQQLLTGLHVPHQILYDLCQQNRGSWVCRTCPMYAV